MSTQRSLSLLPLILAAISLTLYFHPFPAVAYLDSTESTIADFIRTNCNATEYPDLCYTSLSPYASAIQQSLCQLAMVSINVSLARVHEVDTYVTKISHEAAGYAASSRAAAALQDCCSNLDDTMDETVDSLKQMTKLSPAAGEGSDWRFMVSNVQTWLSAALTDEETCTGGFQDVPDEPMKGDVCGRVDNVKKFTSNALALVNVYASKGSP